MEVVGLDIQLGHVLVGDFASGEVEGLIELAADGQVDLRGRGADGFDEGAGVCQGVARAGFGRRTRRGDARSCSICLCQAGDEGRRWSVPIHRRVVLEVADGFLRALSA